MQATGTAGDAAVTAESRARTLRRTVEQFDEKDKFEFMLLDASGVILANSSGIRSADLTGGSYASETSDENAILIDTDEAVSLTDPTVAKTGDSDGGDSCNFYGLNAAVLAKGSTRIENAAKEPHIVDVANFLNSMGADIRGAGTDVIRIKGVEKFHDTEYSVIPDQIEAGTFMMAAAATRGDVLIRNVIPKHLETISAKLSEIGAEIEESDDAVRVVATQRLCNTQIKTLPYPGFPTDMQPQMAITLGLSTGTSTITESIFENRFKYVDELIRMGADIKVEGNTAVIYGTEKLMGARVSAPDLRAGAALVIAGLAAEGITIVDDIVYIQRGYENFEQKLRGLGAEIERVSSEKEIQKFKLRVG